MLTELEKEVIATRTKAMTIEEMEEVLNNIPLDLLEKNMMARLTEHTAKLQRVYDALRGCANESED